jgi:hypothetical protein
MAKMSPGARHLVAEEPLSTEMMLMRCEMAQLRK